MRERTTTPEVVAETTEADRFGVLYQAHYPAIHAYCARRTDRDRVDDAVADTFLVAWRRIDDVPDGREALLWLYGIARRVVGHQWRSSARRARLRQRIGGLRSVAAPGPAERALEDDECRWVLDAIGHLKAADAELLLLAAWEQLSTADLATVLDVTNNTASQRLSRARQQLAREFDRIAERSIDPLDARQGGAG